jgi:hypothetical protein
MTKAVARDAWNLDTALAKWLGKRLLWLAENAHGIPGPYLTYAEDGFNTVDDDKAMARWRKDLRTHGKALQDYGKGKVANRDDGLEKAQDALRWVAKRLPCLWD